MSACEVLELHRQNSVTEKELARITLSFLAEHLDGRRCHLLWLRKTFDLKRAVILGGIIFIGKNLKIQVNFK